MTGLIALWNLSGLRRWALAVPHHVCSPSVCGRRGLLVHDQEAGPRQAAGEPARLPPAVHSEGHLPARARQTHARPERLHREEDTVLQEGHSVPASRATHMEDVGHEGQCLLFFVKNGLLWIMDERQTYVSLTRVFLRVDYLPCPYASLTHLIYGNIASIW